MAGKKQVLEVPEGCDTLLTTEGLERGGVSRIVCHGNLISETTQPTSVVKVCPTCKRTWNVVRTPSA